MMGVGVTLNHRLNNVVNVVRDVLADGLLDGGVSDIGVDCEASAFIERSPLPCRQPCACLHHEIQNPCGC